MKTPYDAGLRLRKQEMDELRRQLGALYTRQEAIEKTIADIDAEVEAEARRASPSNMANLLDFGAYLGRQRLAKDAFNRELTALQTEIDKLQDAVASAFADFKTLDIAAARFRENARLEAAQREQAELDEAALVRHQSD